MNEMRYTMPPNNMEDLEQLNTVEQKRSVAKIKYM